MRDENAVMRDRLKASELLGKSEGDFLDRAEATGFPLEVPNIIVNFVEPKPNPEREAAE
jgi:hypothetical protein